jgi:putative hydrolase
MLRFDCHIHTLLSGHAFMTFYEVAGYCAKKRIGLIAITDHGPKISGESIRLALMASSRAPRELSGVKVLWGVEANIMDRQGNLDVEDGILEKLDIVLAQRHYGVGEELSFKAETQAVIAAIRSGRIDVLSHPLTPDYDIEKVAQAAFNNNVLLELNLSYLRKQGWKQHRKLVDIHKKANKKLIVNSDAHFLEEIGDDSLLRQNWDNLGMDEDLIITKSELLLFLKNRRQQL